MCEPAPLACSWKVTGRDVRVGSGYNFFLLSRESASAHSDAWSTRQSDAIDSTVCEDNPNLQPMTHVPARRAVRMSTLESPIIRVSSGETAASRISALSPSGSGFLLAKLFPP